MSKPFKGILDLDLRDRIPVWGPFLLPKAKDGSPSALFIVLGDSGIAAHDTFGSLIEIPTLKRNAKMGLRSGNWHKLPAVQAHMRLQKCRGRLTQQFPAAGN
jgi:hypothetical protein